MTDDWCFDPERAFVHVQRLCHPRGLGTPGELRAIEYVSEEFKGAGLDVHHEPFRLSHFPAAVGSRLVFTVCAVLAVMGALLAPRQPILALICWAMAAYLVNAPWRVTYWLGGNWPPFANSANLIARLPTLRSEAPARVVFMAHYDTKSQLVPTAIRVILVTAVTAICIFLAALALLSAVGHPGPLQTAGNWLPTIIVVVALMGLMANMTGNRSPGALDNGSAVGSLLELARTWRPKLEAPADVLWVATGAEEHGLHGAFTFLASHGHLWNDKPTLLINLECVGANGKTYLAGQPFALAIAQRLATEMGIQHAPLRVLGAGMDHQPFAARNLPCVSILGDVVRHSFALHSSRDNMTLIDQGALARSGALASQLAWHWAATAGQGAVVAEVVAPA